MEDEHTVADTLAAEAARGPRVVDPLEALVRPRPHPEAEPHARARDVLAAYAARTGNWLREARWRWRSRRQVVVNALLVLCGMTLGCVGGWLIAWWALGLVLLVYAAGLIFVGLNRDDNLGDRPARGARTVAQAHEDARLAMEAQERREAEAASL